MKIFFIVIALVFIFVMEASAVTLEGKITYTVDTARKVTFENVLKTIPISSFQTYLIDYNYKENKDFIKYGIEPKDREVEVFYKGPLKIAYVVNYKNKPDYTYYYTKLGGALIYIDIEQKDKKLKSKYPLKFYRYDTRGKLVAAGLMVSENEGFLYDKKEKLKVHRLGDNGYNSKGKKIWNAEELDF